MDKITEMMRSAVFAGFVRAIVAAGCGAAVKHGVDIGSYVEPITGGIIMVLVMWWSQRAKKPRRTGEKKRSRCSASVLALCMVALCGCSTFMASDQMTTRDRKNPDLITTHDVSVWRGSVLMKSELDTATIKYGEVEIGIGGFSQQGDKEMAEAIGNAISNGIVAWFTYGTAPAVKGAVMATLKGTVTNEVGKACQ